MPVWHSNRVAGGCEIDKEERDALEQELRELDVCDIEQFGRLESSEKTIAIPGNRWWPQTTKQDGNRMIKQSLCNVWKKRNERPNFGGVSIRSRNGAPSRKRCVVNGQMTKNEYAPPPSSYPTQGCGSIMTPPQELPEAVSTKREPSSHVLIGLLVHVLVILLVGVRRNPFRAPKSPSYTNFK